MLLHALVGLGLGLSDSTDNTVQDSKVLRRDKRNRVSLMSPTHSADLYSSTVDSSSGTARLTTPGEVWVRVCLKLALGLIELLL